MGLNPLITVIGAVTLFLLFFISGILARIKGKWPKLVPVPLVVIVLAGLVSWILGLEEK